MSNPKQYIVAITFLMSLHITKALPAKTNARPVHEIINEQARIDDKIKFANTPGSLPYGNPLAGNSQQNARLHAQNQQAMFNAERIRQHRAQLQRWNKAPQQIDSYMKAYHESQESHQLALEQQQANFRDLKAGPVTNLPQKSRPAPNTRRETLKRGPRVVPTPELTKITKEDAIIKLEKNRNHRSYGSVEYQQYLEPKRYQTIYGSPSPSNDEGVTIKPNGNVGLTHQQNTGNEHSKLYTETVSSNTKYVYPKQYSQMQYYQSAQDIDALSSLLKKNPKDQLSELNTLLSAKQNGEENKNVLDTPIDLYFYVKDAPVQTLTQHYEQTKDAQFPQNYASAYMPEHVADVKDHIPISEEVDDIADPDKDSRLRTYGLQSIIATQQPQETTTTKSNNYYKVEVASQTISAGHTVPAEQVKPVHYLKEEETPTYEALQYAEHPIRYYVQKDPKTEGDVSERYLHHNAQHKGVQRLNEDGTGVSAYGDENLHYAANYEFGYRVHDHHSGNDFGHHESKRDGKTNGHYHVLLPDGRMQKVQYSAGPEGFHADISYDHLQLLHH